MVELEQWRVERERMQRTCGHSIVARRNGVLVCSWCSKPLDELEQIDEPA